MVDHNAQGPRTAHSDNRRWWMQNWLLALGRLVPKDTLDRGRALWERDAVKDLRISVGLAAATVHVAPQNDCRVQVTVRTLSESDWDRVLRTLASQAIYSAQLLNGDTPYEIESIFQRTGLALFPSSPSDLRPRCSCSDFGQACSHVGAVYYALGQALANDPFVLFTLRGRSRELIMSALRQLRAEDISDSLDGSAIERGIADQLPLAESLDSFWRLGDEIDGVQIRVTPPEVDMELLKILGKMPFVQDENAHQKLADVIRAVSAKALDVAFDEHESE